MYNTFLQAPSCFLDLRSTTDCCTYNSYSSGDNVLLIFPNTSVTATFVCGGQSLRLLCVALQLSSINSFIRSTQTRTYTHTQAAIR